MCKRNCTPEQLKAADDFDKLIENKLSDCLICNATSDSSTEIFVYAYILGFRVGVGSDKVDMPLCETHNLELVQAYVSMLQNDLSPAPQTIVNTPFPVSQKKCCGGCKKGKPKNE